MSYNYEEEEDFYDKDYDDTLLTEACNALKESGPFAAIARSPIPLLSVI